MEITLSAGYFKKITGDFNKSAARFIWEVAGSDRLLVSTPDGDLVEYNFDGLNWNGTND